jgi:hypothetical protein
MPTIDGMAFPDRQPFCRINLAIVLIARRFRGAYAVTLKGLRDKVN